MLDYLLESKQPKENNNNIITYYTSNQNDTEELIPIANAFYPKVINIVAVIEIINNK